MLGAGRPMTPVRTKWNYALSAGSGLRIGIAIKWAQIDLSQRQFAIVQAKNGANPLSPESPQNSGSGAPRQPLSAFSPVWRSPSRGRGAATQLVGIYMYKKRLIYGIVMLIVYVGTVVLCPETEISYPQSSCESLQLRPSCVTSTSLY